jgi:hypothetical protein
METLRRQIRRAHRRMILQSFLAKLAWCLFATLLVASAAIAVGKYWPVGEARTWELAWLGSAVGAGVLLAGLWTWLTRESALNAAAEIDRRFGLKERVSSSLALGPSELESPIAQALVSDAVERVRRIDVGEKFGVRLGAPTLLPLLPAAVAIALVFLVSGPVPQSPAVAAPTEASQIKKSAQSLAKKLDEKRKHAEEAGMKETDAILQQMETDAKLLADKGADRRHSLVALNELSKQAEKRRQQVAGAAELKQQLNQLKNIGQGPAQKLAQALKNGDLQKAMTELDKLQEKLKADNLDAKERQELAKQMGDMQKALEKMAQAHKQAQEELKEQIEQQRKAGNVAEADKLQQQLDKLAEKSPQVEKLSRLAENLGRSSQCSNAAECKQAADALENLKGELAGMQKELDELETLDSAMDQLTQAKNSMTCKECEGEGCEACQGDMAKFSNRWRESKMARGGGIGAGERAERKNDTGFIDSQVKQNVGKGASVITGTADGPNRKGQVREEIKSEFSGAEQKAAEALSGQRLPHDYRDHAKKYFDSLREGQQ